VAHEASATVEEVTSKRRRLILTAFEELRPDVVFVELYPFGRKKFAFELEPLLERAVTATPRPVVVCSLRDILVSQRRDQARHDERASTTVNRYFDAVLVHADPTFATLDESFRPATPLRVPVLHTGFVAPPTEELGSGPRSDRVIVSAGGGMVGEPLFHAAVAAAGPIRARAGLETLVVAGPFLPEPAWDWLERQQRPGLTICRRVDGLASEIARSAVSVSQCGYNTTMDLIRDRTPAVVVPFSEGREDEQRRRADRLDALGVLTMLPPDQLTPQRLADAVIGVASSRPHAIELDLDGARRSADITLELVRARRGDHRTDLGTIAGVAAVAGVAR
jgi:predicted glycosyltransferase